MDTTIYSMIYLYSNVGIPVPYKLIDTKIKPHKVQQITKAHESVKKAHEKIPWH